MVGELHHGVFRMDSCQVRAMHILLTLKESHHGSWCICREAVVLFDGLRFARAIKLARQLAEDLPVDPDDTVHLQLAGSEFASTFLPYPVGRTVLSSAVLA